MKNPRQFKNSMFGMIKKLLAKKDEGKPSVKTKASKIDRKIYAMTQKPEYYVEVEREPMTNKEKLQNPQLARQVQYNKWSKAKKIYSGSYLPYDNDKLEKCGWEDFTDSRNVMSHIKDYRRKSTGQEVQWNQGDNNAPNKAERKFTHYHWVNLLNKDSNSKLDKYFDKYGKLCNNKSAMSHISPYDNNNKKVKSNPWIDLNGGVEWKK